MSCPFSVGSAHYGGSLVTRKRRAVATGSSNLTDAKMRIRESILGTQRKTTTKKRASRVPPKRRVTTRSRPASRKKEYFLRPDRMTADTKKYCRCLEAVGGTYSGKGCYAACSRMKPASMKGGCAMLYDYKNMPYALKKGAATIRGKNIKELVDAARREAEYMKHA